MTETQKPAFELRDEIVLFEESAGSYILFRNQKQLRCPFREVEYLEQKTSTIALAAGRPDEVNIKRFEKACGSWCPKFQIEVKGNGKAQVIRAKQMCGQASSHIIHGLASQVKRAENTGTATEQSPLTVEK